MEVYRISKSQHINDLSGTGAKIYGARWNFKGTSIIYTSENRSLATVEFLVHVHFSITPANLSIATLSIPDKATLKEIDASDLPHNWKDYPPPLKLAEIGSGWAKSNETLLLRVPSSVVEKEYNILINPLHSEMKNVKISHVEPYTYDRRLLEKGKFF